MFCENKTATDCDNNRDCKIINNYDTDIANNIYYYYTGTAINYIFNAELAKFHPNGIINSDNIATPKRVTREGALLPVSV